MADISYCSVTGRRCGLLLIAEKGFIGFSKKFIATIQLPFVISNICSEKQDKQQLRSRFATNDSYSRYYICSLAVAVIVTSSWLGSNLKMIYATTNNLYRHMFSIIFENRSFNAICFHFVTYK